MNYKIKRGNKLKRCQDHVSIFCYQVTTKQTLHLKPMEPKEKVDQGLGESESSNKSPSSKTKPLITFYFLPNISNTDLDHESPLPHSPLPATVANSALFESRKAKRL